MGHWAKLRLFCTRQVSCRWCRVLRRHTEFTATQPWHRPQSLQDKAGHSPGIWRSWPMNLYDLLIKVCLDGWISRNCFLCELSSNKYLLLISVVLILQLLGIIAPYGLMKQEVSMILKVTNKGRQRRWAKRSLNLAFWKFPLHLAWCVSGNPWTTQNFWGQSSLDPP